MKVICLVLNSFTSDSRVLKTSKSLSRFGYEVKVVALHDDGLSTFERVQGVLVYRIALAAKRLPKVKILQIVKYIEFTWRFVSKFRDIDVLHCNDLDALSVGVICKLTRPSLKIIYDSHEFAANDIPNQARLSIAIKFFMEFVLIRFANKVITVSDSIAKMYSSLYKIRKPHLILNCPNYIEQQPKNLFREKFPIKKSQHIFLYQGALGKGRGCELLIEAFKGLSEKHNCVLVFLGYGANEGLIRDAALKMKNIFFHPAVKPELLLDYTSSADYGLCLIEDSCLSLRFCLPNKIFEYLMAGLPVLTSNLFELASLVSSESVGVVCRENTPEGVRAAILSALQQNYKKIRENVVAARVKYCWETQENELYLVYQSIRR
jgi:glycosyltransferase involved in cell wall biosynthesis